MQAWYPLSSASPQVTAARPASTRSRTQSVALTCASSTRHVACKRLISTVGTICQYRSSVLPCGCRNGGAGLSCLDGEIRHFTFTAAAVESLKLLTQYGFFSSRVAVSRCPCFSFRICVCFRPRYVVPETTKQATLTGSEHGRAVPLLSFGVVGVSGAPGDEDEHRALTTAVRELVTLMTSFFVPSVLVEVYCTLLRSYWLIRRMNGSCKPSSLYFVLCTQQNCPACPSISLKSFVCGVTSMTGNLAITKRSRSF